VSEDFLAQMAGRSRVRVERARALRPEGVLRGLVARLPPPPPLSLSAEGFDLIAELKLRSPASGALAATSAASREHVAARVVEYAGAGAAAVSVLTEPSRFDGSMTHLEAAASALAVAPGGAIPAMRKDFLVDPYQVLEARAAGAGGVLVILRMLPQAACEALVDEALAQGLFVLIETFDEAEIDAAGAIVAARDAGAGRLLVGVNCRDLVTLQVVPGRLEQLAGRLPEQAPRVAESGVASADDAARLAAAGYDLALVGSALMTGATPRELAGAMLRAGRTARGGRRRCG
jgi:indole-3-glycerol phosphate synthase